MENLKLKCKVIKIGREIYIVSDREIKEGELNVWAINKDRNTIYKIGSASKDAFKYWDRIEASTDKSLGLPEPSPEFVRKYVELQGRIDEIMVDMKEWDSLVDGPVSDIMSNKKDIVLVPKVDRNNYITITKVIEDWDNILDRMSIEVENHGDAHGLTYEEIQWLKQNYNSPTKIKS